jgi:predicted nucleotidyltransferase
MMCVESWETTNKLKQKERRYGVNPERFRLACDLWGVPWGSQEQSTRATELPVRNARHAWHFASAFAQAATDAPQRKTIVATPGGNPRGPQSGGNWVSRV